MFRISIDQTDKKPIYKQLLDQLETAIRSGVLSSGDLLPSMSVLSSETGISRETVKKVYGILSGKDLVVAKQGKGFYVADPADGAKPRILLLFDKFSIYKQVIYNSFVHTLEGKAEFVILTHNQSLDLLEFYLDNYLGKFDYYVVTPHFPLDETSQKRAVKLVSRIPNRKLILLDRLLPGFQGNFGSVYQDFENDIYYGLAQGLDQWPKTSSLRVMTMPQSLYGQFIRRGVERFCSEFSIPVEFLTGAPSQVNRGDTFLVLNSQLDYGLVELSRIIRANDLKIGSDVRIISYNEYYINEIVLDGLTTVSADFIQMGREAARMILDRNLSKVHCDFKMVRRNTF